MSKLIITRGYPGSGKTTIARKMVESELKMARVNRDDIRYMMFEKHVGLTKDQEDVITVVQRAMTADLLNEGWSVIIDDTNLNPRSSSMWKQVAWMNKAVFEVINVTTDVGECIKRDNSRKAAGERFVGWDIIEWFAHRYPMPWPEVT